MVLTFLQNEMSAGSGDREKQRIEQYLTDLDRPWWFKTAREIRESDEAKVRDYKEDIDTLLVFGALFSAVITALVIESYKNLSQDPSELTAQILLHVSQQLSSYHVNGQFSNSTISSFSLPTFIPSKSMIIVNMMWFGSLTISLMATSYGMLVKQWLREYLANRDASPLARLRIRCFRYPALAKWKVFEIVAILPLLLQLALGLFFVGLCYFASSIHPAIQWTVIPLVVIWASLFISATFAPIVSASCPYKTTFLKDVLAQLRRTKLMMFQKVAHTSANIPTVVESVEEDAIAKNDITDFDVLAQVDATQADDGLISPALVDLGRQHPGPGLISFIFTILGHRDPTITPANIDNLLNIQRLSKPLLQAVYTAITEALRVEYRKAIVSSGGQLVKWDGWVQDSFRLLLLMSHPTPQSNETLGNCLTISDPDALDGLMDPVMDSNGWSEEHKTMFVKAVVQLINPSSMDPADLRPLKLSNLSAQSTKYALTLFESSIFPEGINTPSTQAWDQEVRFGFRGVFGEIQHHAPRDLCERIRTSFDIDEVVGHLLSTTSDSETRMHGPYDLCVIAYSFRIIQIYHKIPKTFDLSFLSKRCWSILCRLFMNVLKVELMKKTEGLQDGSTWDGSVFDAIYAMLSTVQYPPGMDCIELIASFFRLDPETLSNNLMEHFSKSGSPPSIAVSTILRLLVKLDIAQEDPWSTKLKISTTFSQPDMFANIAAKCLAALQESNPPDDPEMLRSASWAIHILLSCVEVSGTFSDSTISAIDNLTQSHAYFIVRAFPQKWKDQQPQVGRLWNTIRLLSPSRQLLFIMQLWPKLDYYNGAIPSELLRRYATDQNQTTTEVFLHTLPQFSTNKKIITNFVARHIDYSRTLDDAARRECVNELQPFLESNATWSSVLQTTASLIWIRDPGWPEWMKEFILKEFTELRDASELSDTLKRCLCNNPTELVALLASHDIECLDRLPNDALTYREVIGQPLKSMFPTLTKHPEPLSLEKAEGCLMRLFVNAKVNNLAWTFSTYPCFLNGDPSPRYACVSIILRILQYHLSSKNIQIPQRDIRSPLDLSQLEKEVWDDVSAAAAEVLNRDDFYHDGMEGRKTYNIARTDAIMVLLADSPHSLSNDLSYQVLHQESFFRWEDNPSIQMDTRQELEKRRQSRIEEGRRLGYPDPESSAGTKDGDEDDISQDTNELSEVDSEEHHDSSVESDGDAQEDQAISGSGSPHEDMNNAGLEEDGVEVKFDDSEGERANASVKKHETPDDGSESQERERDDREGGATS
ncbi:hypothetical protein QCA50_015140 [Cerrena zonata]|uniref:DUF6535 domain-containing protein n=1 Tax=Cerrena zonata TaxID=2478898 RepID=A0AAW0FKX1_9APHY